jgi:ABC-2 type transport system ATP-binding protein
MLEIKDLTKRFGKTVALKELTLKAKKGEIYGLIGPNGAGKTTTVKMIVGLLKPTSGEVFVSGVSTIKAPLKAKSLIGYIPDEPTAYENLSGRELLHFVGNLFGMKREERAKRIASLLPLFSLEKIADGYFGEYSRGNKQKFVILTALIHNPQYLIIDEPVVGLDPESALLAKKLFSDFAKEGGTIFVCSHTLSYLEDLCSKVGVLDEGVLIKEGKLKDFLKGKRGKNLEEAYLNLVKTSPQQ